MTLLEFEILCGKHLVDPAIVAEDLELHVVEGMKLTIEFVEAFIKERY